MGKTKRRLSRNTTEDLIFANKEDEEKVRARDLR
uniref:Uncharacterized protein n=1 Tax=Cucumis melo TaxID=3656 RepID=A0A9I9DWB8_CUCME